MPDPISWLYLTRDVNDTQTIEEAIDADLLTHNLDPSAHGQTSEAIYEHRVAPLLDHLNYVIYNSKMNPAARVFKAIVDSGGVGDFRTIQEAIDYCNIQGGGTVFIRAGTHDVSAGLTMYSNIKLQGEDDDLSILDFGASYNYIACVGTSGTHKKNISFENIGFTDFNCEDWIIKLSYVDDVIIQDCKFYLSDPANYDSITPITCYTGSNRIFIRRNRFEGLNAAIFLYGASKVWITENYFYHIKSDTLRPGSSSHVIIRNNVFEDCSYGAGGSGVIWSDTDIVNLHVEGNQFIDCLVGAMAFADLTRAVIVDNRIDGQNGFSYGIVLNGCTRCTVVSNNIDNCDTDGIRCDANSDQNTIVGNTCTNCADAGVDIDSADCDKNLVVGNVLTLNGTALADAGTGTVKDHNVT